MQEIICPNCGTTYPKFEPGICECCGYKFTVEYLNPLIKEAKKKALEEKKERLVQEKIDVIKRKKQEKERLKAERFKAKKRIEEEKALDRMRKEREQREKLKKIIEKQPEIIERDKNFSLKFKKFRNIFSKVGVVLSIFSICFCIFASVQNRNAEITSGNIIYSKIETITNAQMLGAIKKFEQAVGVVEKNQGSLNEKTKFIHFDKLINFLKDDGFTETEQTEEND